MESTSPFPNLMIDASVGGPSTPSSMVSATVARTFPAPEIRSSVAPGAMPVTSPLVGSTEAMAGSPVEKVGSTWEYRGDAPPVDPMARMGRLSPTRRETLGYGVKTSSRGPPATTCHGYGIVAGLER